MTVDRLFSSLMQAERSLLITIGNNIGGGRAEAGALAPAIVQPQGAGAAAGAASHEPMPVGLGAPAFSRALQPNVPASHTLVGLRPAMTATAPPGAATAIAFGAAAGLPSTVHMPPLSPAAANLSGVSAATATAGAATAAFTPAETAASLSGAAAGGAAAAATQPAAIPSPSNGVMQSGPAAATVVSELQAAADPDAASQPNGTATSQVQTSSVSLDRATGRQDLSDERASAFEADRLGGARTARAQTAATSKGEGGTAVAPTPATADAQDAGQRAVDDRRLRAAAQEQASLANARFAAAADPPGAPASRQAGHPIETWATPVSSTAPSERAGIIASCILNAAMIPGWPAPRPIELAAGRALVPERQPAGAPIDENEAFTYLANMGASRSLLDRIHDLMRPLARRLKLLLALAVLATLMTSALKALQDELAALAGEMEAAGQEDLVGGRRHIAG